MTDNPGPLPPGMGDPVPHRFRPFWVVRDVDVTGISGTGVVGEGIQFSDGTVVMRWLKAGTARPDAVQPTTVIHPSIENVVALHGHDGKTWVQFADSVNWPPAGERNYP